MKIRPAFTLIEVMLAMAIFAVMITGFALALDQALNMYRQLGDVSRNRRLLESAAALVLATNNNPLPSSAQDFPGMPGVRWQIAEVKIMLTNGELQPPFRKVVLEVEKAEGQKRLSLILPAAR